MSFYRVLTALYLFIPIFMLSIGYMLGPYFKELPHTILGTISYYISGGLVEIFARQSFKFPESVIALVLPTYFLIIAILMLVHSKLSIFTARIINWLLPVVFIIGIPFVQIFIAKLYGSTLESGFLGALIIAFIYFVIPGLLVYLPFMLITHFVLTKELKIY